MEDKKINSISASERIFNILLKKIRNKQYQANDKLPPETELSLKYGVSRNTVRSAINKLATLGMVETFQGSGTFVKEVDFSSRVENLVPQFFRDTNDYISLMNLRTAVESQSASLAAITADGEEIKKLEAIVLDLEAHRDDLNYCSDHDIDFHLKVAEISHNRLLFTLVQMIRSMLNDILIDFILDFGNHESMISHRRILDAIKEADPIKARDAMWKHMQTVVDRYLFIKRNNESNQNVEENHDPD